MYKKIEIKKGISSFYINEKYVKYVQKSLEGKIKVENHLKEVIFTSEQNWINRSCLVGDNLCYSSYDEDFTRIQKLDNNKSIILDVLLSDITSDTPNIYNNLYYNLSEIDNNCIYDLVIGKEVGKCKNEIKGFIKLNTDNHIVTGKYLQTYIYIYIKTDFTLLWQKNIRDIFNEEDRENNQLQIQEIYAYKNTFIIVTTFGTVCLKQVDGSLIWKTDSYARTMEIVGNIGYVCTSLSLYKINLDTGEESGYGWIHDRLPDFEYGDRSYWPAGHRVVYHNGFLWYLVYDAGDSFIIAINPETGDYEWIHKVDTYEKADEIQFYEDKMFVSDTGGYLHIYEKEE